MTEAWPVHEDEEPTPLFFAVISPKETTVSEPTPDESTYEATNQDISVWDDRHPSVVHFKPLFAFDHLPERLQAISKPCAELAASMLIALPDGPELTVGLRKLLEAKDAFVRQAVLNQG